MGDVTIKHTLYEKTAGEGLYIIEFIKNEYIAYSKESWLIKANDEPIANERDLEKIGIYLLKGLKDAISYAEGKAIKIIRYFYDDNVIKSDTFKAFIILLEAYIIYRQIFLSAAAKNPTLIDFFDNTARLEIYKKLVQYLAKIKMPSLNIETLKVEAIFIILDNYKSILDKEAQDPFIIGDLYKKIAEKISTQAL
jgi:hypothetical protein